MSIYEKLREMKITLPEATPPMAAFVPFVKTGNLVFVSGHIAKKDGRPWTGRLGAGITTEEGQHAARAVAIDVMGTLNTATGDLDKVRRIVKLLVLGILMVGVVAGVIAVTVAARRMREAPSGSWRRRWERASKSNWLLKSPEPGAPLKKPTGR